MSSHSEHFTMSFILYVLNFVFNCLIRWFVLPATSSMPTRWGVPDTTLYQWIVADRSRSPSSHVSCINKTDWYKNWKKKQNIWYKLQTNCIPLFIYMKINCRMTMTTVVPVPDIRIISKITLQEISYFICFCLNYTQHQYINRATVFPLVMLVIKYISCLLGWGRQRPTAH